MQPKRVASVVSNDFDPEGLRSATQIPLTAAAFSPAAKRLVDNLLEKVLVASANRRGMSDKRRADHNRCIAALAGGLLQIAGKNGREAWGWTKTNAGAFSGGPLSYRAFDKVRRGLVAAGFIEERDSFTKFFEFGDTIGKQRFARRLRARPTLLRLAEELGVDVSSPGQHFKSAVLQVRPVQPVRIRRLATRFQGERFRGDELPLPHSHRLETIKADVAETNKLVAATVVQGCEPILFYRGFTHSLDYGGRWYVEGGSYQTLSKEERSRLQIDGEPVVEIDVRASHLTILHGLLGIPMPDGDPYGGFDFPRSAVKSWITATFGAGKVPQRWPSDALTRTAKDGVNLRDLKISQVGRAVLSRYPFLANVPKHVKCESEPRLTSLRLMYYEAEALSATMRHLRVARRALALPMHDALLVQVNLKSFTIESLKQSYRAKTSAVPVITA